MAYKQIVLCNDCMALEPPQEIEGEEIMVMGMFRVHVCPKHRKPADAAQKYLEANAEYVQPGMTRPARRTASGENKAQGNDSSAEEYFACGDCPEGSRPVKKVTKYTHAKTKHNKRTGDITWTPAPAPAL